MESLKVCDFSDIAPIVKFLRKKKKMSRKFASERTGCCPKTIERIESGINGGDIGISKILNLLDTLGYCLEVVPKGRILTMEELQNGARY